MASETASLIPSSATAPNPLPRAALALANVQYEKKGPIAYVTVNRPKVLNALNTPTWTDLKAAFEDAKVDASVHGVILTGAGDKAFIAGADISELAHVDAYEAALKYSQERLQFGKPIASFQLVQDLLAKMISNITASQCLIVRQAQLHAEGKLTDAHAALAKAFATAKCRETVAWARELMGGNGIVADYKAARFFADCEALYSYEGTYQMQNLIVGKAITGLGAFV